MELTENQIKELQTCIALWNKGDERDWADADLRSNKILRELEKTPFTIEGNFKYKFNANLQNFEEDLFSMSVAPTKEELEEEFKEYVITDLLDTLRNQLNGELSCKNITIKINDIPIDVNNR